MDLLPEPLLADILGRLPPRPLAVCRSVSKDLCAVVDGRGLLLALEHRVPTGLHGFFINYVGQDRPYFFSRHAAALRVDAEFDFLPPIGWGEVVHQSNGLVLYNDWNTLYVCNPATRRWAKLPPRPVGFDGAKQLIFDPTVSLHYEVISFSEVPRKPKIPIQPGIERPTYYQGFREYTSEEIKKLPLPLRAKHDREVEIKGSVEWPPRSYAAQVFSSRTGQWKERVYVREDDVAVTLFDVWSDPWGPDSETLSYNSPRCNAVYWRGAFYLHCYGGFIMRLSLTEHKYRVIKTPMLDVFTQPRLDIDDFLSRQGPYMNKEYCLQMFQMEQSSLDRVKPSTHLGKSEHGIYYTAVCWHQLQVWVLREASESQPMPLWELKHKADIGPSILQHYTRKDRDQIEKSWSLDRGEKEPSKSVNYGWDSSDDTTAEGVVHDDNLYYNMSKRMDLLGYHPSKEIAFLGDHFEGFAYYLVSSKLKFLGEFTPVGCCHFLVAATHESFVYTPCMDDLLPHHKLLDTTHDDADYSGGEYGDLEEEVDTNEDENLQEEEVNTDEDENLQEEEANNDEDENLQEEEVNIDEDENLQEEEVNIHKDENQEDV
ncbi:hypothetical protein EJB05_56144, partial [Eragrostis curvula]